MEWIPLRDAVFRNTGNIKNDFFYFVDLIMLNEDDDLTLIEKEYIGKDYACLNTNHTKYGEYAKYECNSKGKPYVYFSEKYIDILAHISNEYDLRARSIISNYKYINWDGIFNNNVLKAMQYCRLEYFNIHRCNLYSNYTSSMRWMGVRDTALRRDNYRCTKCGRRTNLQMHHLSYRYCFCEHIYLKDLTTLCAVCHNLAYTPY